MLKNPEPPERGWYIRTVARVLIVDDDTELAGLLGRQLALDGFETAAVPDGPSGLEEALSGGYDVVILDVMLPDMDGFEVLRRLRASSAVPVLMLTARGEDVDRIVGLEMGADDYLPKPFNPRELVARLRAILRRAGEAPAVGEGVLLVEDLEVDPGARAVRRGGESVKLTGVEFSLLEVLVRRAGQVVGRDELTREVLGRRPSPFDRALDVHVSALRRKLGPLPGGGERIKTVRGVGYLYVRPARGAGRGS